MMFRMLLGVCAVITSNATVFPVINSNDSGPGSLRQAILDSNAAKGSNVIEFDIAGTPPFVIRLQGHFLPPLQGPVVLRVKPAASVVLDGSGLIKPYVVSDCAGLAVQDSHDVEISGMEIRGFCTGIAAIRSSNVYVHDVKIVDNRNGVEITRGTHDSLLQRNIIALTRPLPVDGHAVEFAGAGDRNALIGNTFSKYVGVAVTVGGSDQTIRDNKFISNRNDGLHANGNGLVIEGNTFTDNGGAAMSVGGVGVRVLDNVVVGNEGRGIVVGNGVVTLSRNSIFNNRQTGIDSARGGPVLGSDSTWTADGLILRGTVEGRANQVYTVEVFVSSGGDRQEGERYLGIARAVTDASGKGVFVLPLDLGDAVGNGKTSGWFTATDTDSAGGTSKFSRAIYLSLGERK
jgi:3-dehydroshikimate dehydratase